MGQKFEWTLMHFGKHAGLSLPQLLLRDPDYFFHAIEQRFFKNHPDLAAEAEELHARATAIRIPGNGEEEPLQIEHMIHYPTRKYQGFLVVPASKPLHEGSSTSLRYDHLDMMVPRRFASYDKKGGRLLIRSMKPVYFGKSNARLTKEVCETFFTKSSNFFLEPLSSS